MTDMVWTRTTRVELARRWAAGEYAADIADAMGCTKNAVIGKVHRMKLPSRPCPMHEKGSGTPRDVPRPVPVAETPQLPPLASLVCEALPKSPAPVETLVPAAGCCWPYGEPGARSFRYCDEPTRTRSSPYCSEHLALSRKVARRPPDIRPNGHQITTQFAGQWNVRCSRCYEYDRGQPCPGKPDPIVVDQASAAAA